MDIVHIPLVAESLQKHSALTLFALQSVRQRALYSLISLDSSE